MRSKRSQAIQTANPYLTCVMCRSYYFIWDSGVCRSDAPGAGARSRRMPIQYFKCTGESRFSTSNASAESGECQSTTLNAPQWQPPAPPAAIWGTLCMTVLAFLPSPPRFVTLRNETYNFQLHNHRVDCWSYCWGRPRLNSVPRVVPLPLFCFPDLTKNATGQGK